MRIDGLSSQSYPIKRKPRKGPVVEDESVDIDGELEFPSEEQMAARAAKASAQRTEQSSRPSAGHDLPPCHEQKRRRWPWPAT